MVTFKSSSDFLKGSPVVFHARGLQHDTRLRVFETEYHVHSIILKLHSAYFFKAMGTPGRTAVDNVSVGGFKYEWVTEVEKDGTWFLVAAKPGKKRSYTEDFPKANALKKECEAFGKILCGMYGVTYNLCSFVELNRLIKLGDLYMALPTLSKSITEPLLNSTFSIDIQGRPYEWLAVACKLRSRVLFQDCVIYLAGKWDGSFDIEAVREKCPNAVAAVERVRNDIKILIADAVTYIQEHKALESEMSAMIKKAESKSYVWLPQYFTHVHTKIENFVSPKDAIKPLLTDNRRLDQRQPELDQGDAEYFFCGLVGEKDLPWDCVQTDW